MRSGLFAFSSVVLAPLVALGASACTSPTETGSGAGAASEVPGGGRRPSKPVAAELGTGDGSASSVELTEIYAAGATAKLVDLAWSKTDPGEAWVLGYDSAVYIGKGLDGDAPTWLKRKDPAAIHFMHKPPAIAMGDGGFWGTCGNNDNAQANRTPNYFMGPALFSTNLDVFAQRTPYGLGSHYDMLHASPFCRGIAHVQGNDYWVFNAYDKALDLYKFNEDHGPGNDDHSDGEIYRYVLGQVEGDADGETASHLFFDPSDGFLYVADTGNERIVRLDTSRQVTKVEDYLPRRNEPLVGEGIMGGVDVEVVVAAGALEKPSGLEVKDDILYVTDAATSTFHAFDKTGKEVRRLETGLPAGSLAGFTFGPDGKIWFVDKLAGKLIRIDPR